MAPLTCSIIFTLFNSQHHSISSDILSIRTLRPSNRCACWFTMQNHKCSMKSQFWSALHRFFSSSFKHKVSSLADCSIVAFLLSSCFMSSNIRLRLLAAKRTHGTTSYRRPHAWGSARGRWSAQTHTQHHVLSPNALTAPRLIAGPTHGGSARGRWSAQTHSRHHVLSPAPCLGVRLGGGGRPKSTHGTTSGCLQIPQSKIPEDFQYFQKTTSKQFKKIFTLFQ